MDSIDWLVEWCIVWLNGRSIDWLIDRSMDPWIDCLIDWLFYCVLLRVFGLGAAARSDPAPFPAVAVSTRHRQHPQPKSWILSKFFFSEFVSDRIVPPIHLSLPTPSFMINPDGPAWSLVDFVCIFYCLGPRLRTEEDGATCSFWF